MKYIQVEEQNNKVIIRLNNPPVNSESLALLREIIDEIKKHKNKIIVFLGHQVSKNGRNIYSAGGDIKELREGKAHEVGYLINQIALYLNSSDNLVVTIMGGDGVGGGWGMPFDISDKIYFLKNSNIVSGFTRNGITPGCGLYSLLMVLNSEEAYNFIKSEKLYPIRDLANRDTKWLEEFDSYDNVDEVIKNIEVNIKKDRTNIKRKHIENEDILAELINAFIDNPTSSNEIQLKYLKLTSEV